MSTFETAVVSAWLYETLSGDTGLVAAAPGGIWQDVAPPDITSPIVVFTLYDNHDVHAVGAIRIMNNSGWLIKGISPGWGVEDSKALAAEIDDLLQAKSGAPADGKGVIVSCVRERIVDYTEMDGPNIWRHVGGVYSIQAQRGS